MEISGLYQSLYNWAGDNAWIAQVFIVVFLVLLLNLALRIGIRHLHQKLRTTQNRWDDAVVAALQQPLRLLVWIVGIAFAADIVRLETGAAIFNAVGAVRDVGVIATLTWFLLRLARNHQQNVVARSKEKEHPADVTTADAIGKLVRASILITAALVVLQTLGFSISGVLAFGGIGGIAIGFAAKDLLANFFGGLMIDMDRPFAVVNFSRMTHRRINETIGLRYDNVDKLPAILADVELKLQQHLDIDTTQTLMVNFNCFAASSLEFFIYTFTHTTVWTRYHEIKQDVLLKVSNIITHQGAEIAFPTTTLHVAPITTAAEFEEMATHATNTD